MTKNTQKCKQINELVINGVKIGNSLKQLDEGCLELQSEFSWLFDSETNLQ